MRSLNRISVDKAIARRGIIKNLFKNTLFLSDPKNFPQTNGIYAEQANNVTILGQEFLQNQVGGEFEGSIAMQNKI